jgi:hypothetical protein
MSTELTARNATAADLMAILNTQKAHKNDIVVPAKNVKSSGGLIVVKDSESQVGDDGVTTVNGTYRPTDVFDDGLAEKLGIPRQYLRKLRTERPDILDGTVNGFLHGRSRKVIDGDATPPRSRTEVIYPADDRAFLLRLFRGDDGGEGVARAMLSDRYSLSMDNVDVLTAVMQGIAKSGVNVISRVSDLSERRMRVRFEAPDVNVLAPGLIDGYKSPFDGDGAVRRAGTLKALQETYGPHHIFKDKDAPVVFMGFDFTNSETGGGAYTLTPIIEVLRCSNGLVMRKEGVRKVHLGARLEAGLVRPSFDTLRKAGELVAAETRDAVTQWLKTDYLEKLIAGLEEKAGHPVAKSTETVPAVCAGLGFTATEQAGILDMFIASSQITAGGIAQAISAFAQTVEDVDRAYEIELRAIEGMEMAAAR